MKKILLALAILGLLTTKIYADWDNTAPANSDTVAVAAPKVRGNFTALDGTSGVAPTTVAVKTQLQFEGATADAFETILTITDPTADRVITFPNATGIPLLDTDITNQVLSGASPLTFEGATANAFETTITVTDPTADRVITLPNITGTVAVSGADFDLGTFELRANTLQSDVATGTAPLTVASTTKVTNLNADTVDGINSNSTDLKPLGAWVDKSSSYEAQQAATDGFVIAYTADKEDTTIVINGYTDASADPTTLIARSTTKPLAGSIATVSITFPVKKGDYWKITLVNVTIGKVYWIPLGS